MIQSKQKTKPPAIPATSGGLSTWAHGHQPSWVDVRDIQETKRKIHASSFRGWISPHLRGFFWAETSAFEPCGGPSAFSLAIGHPYAAIGVRTLHAWRLLDANEQCLSPDVTEAASVLAAPSCYSPSSQALQLEVHSGVDAQNSFGARKPRRPLHPSSRLRCGPSTCQAIKAEYKTHQNNDPSRLEELPSAIHFLQDL